MDVITPLSSSSLVGSATSQGRGWSGQAQHLLALGQLLKATVVEAREGGYFTLDIGGSRLTASSTAQLAQGQSLQLQVVTTEPLVELRIIHDNPTAPFAGRPLTLLGKGFDLSSLIQLVREITPGKLETLSPFTRNVLESFLNLTHNILEGKNSGTALKQLIDTLGLKMEHFLANGDKSGAAQSLKAALLELAHAPGSPDKIAESAARIMTTIELFQLARFHLGTDDSIILPLPLPFIEQGYLLVEGEGQNSENGYRFPGENRFSLHLTMSDLGNLRIDFLRNAEGLFIRFSSDCKEKANFLAGFGDDLKATITDIPLISLFFSGDAPDPINVLIRKLVPDGKSMLDIKV